MWLRRRRPTLDAAFDVDWLVAGLGNPGDRYQGTRHNVGRIVVDDLARRHDARLNQSKFETLFGFTDLSTNRVCLARCLKYMNESGPPLAALGRFFKVPPERMIMVYDELDLPIGVVRVRAGGGAGGHRGTASVSRALGTEAFPRVRVGIGRPPDGWEAADYVLGRFTDAEQDTIARAVERAADAVAAVVSQGVDAAMNTFN